MGNSMDSFRNSRAKIEHFHKNLLPGQIIYEANLVQRYLEKQKTQNAPEYIKDLDQRKISQDVHLALTKFSDILIDNLREMKNELYNYILQEMKYVSNSQQKIFNTVSDERLEEIMTSCLPALSKLQSASNHKLCKRGGTFKEYTLYESMFNNLILIDPRFIIYAPIKCVIKENNISQLNKLDAKTQNKCRVAISNLKTEPTKDYIFKATSKENYTPVKNEKIEALINKQLMTEQTICKEMVNVVEEMAENLANFILKEDKLQIRDDVNLTYKDIKDILKYCDISLKNLKNFSEDKELIKVGNWKDFSPYDYLWSKLIDQNIRFAYRASFGALNRYDIDFTRMQEEERKHMADILFAYGLFDNNDYFMNYKTQFNLNPNEFDRMHSLQD